MRTTVTIDDHLLERVKDHARAHNRTLGAVLEASLQHYVALPTLRPGPDLPVFRPGGGVLPGIDETSNASLLEAADGPVEVDGDLR